LDNNNWFSCWDLFHTSIFTIPSRAEIPRINAIATAAPVPVSELADGDDGVDGEGV
jgi:hypothetical protein